MKALLLLVPLMIACGPPAEYKEHKDPVPVVITNPPPAATPCPEVVTPVQCVDLLRDLSKYELDCLRKYLKKGHKSYYFGNTLVTLDDNCIEFILYYNCPKCK